MPSWQRSRVPWVVDPMWTLTPVGSPLRVFQVAVEPSTSVMIKSYPKSRADADDEGKPLTWDDGGWSQGDLNP
jgi:hypothetical protein